MKRKTAQIGLLALLIVVGLTGCAQFEQHPGELETKSPASQFRKAINVTTQFGLDPRSREIERNLGVN